MAKSPPGLSLEKNDIAGTFLGILLLKNYSGGLEAESRKERTDSLDRIFSEVAKQAEELTSSSSSSEPDRSKSSEVNPDASEEEEES